MVAIPLSYAIGGPLSSTILGMDGVAGLHGWQWLFLMEDVPAFLLSFAALKLLPDGPEDARWLTIDEKKAIAVRLAAEDAPGRRDLWRALRDPRVFGGFFGPSLFGVLKEGTGDYATGMAATAFGMMLAALIVLAVPRDGTASPRWRWRRLALPDERRPRAHADLT